MKTGPAALDPKNTQHWSGHGLPGGYYMPATPGPVRLPKPSPEQERKHKEWVEDLKHRRAAGTLSPFEK